MSGCRPRASAAASASVAGRVVAAVSTTWRIRRRTSGAIGASGTSAIGAVSPADGRRRHRHGGPKLPRHGEQRRLKPPPRLHLNQGQAGCRASTRSASSSSRRRSAGSVRSARGTADMLARIKADRQRNQERMRIAGIQPE
jgi:hypothetical protein